MTGAAGALALKRRHTMQSITDMKPNFRYNGPYSFLPEPSPMPTPGVQGRSIVFAAFSGIFMPLPACGPGVS